MRLFVVASLLLAFSLAGCVGDSNTSIAGQGSKEGTASRELDCGDTGQLAIGVQGEGRVTISVVDGSGSRIYSESFSGGGQQGESTTLRGNAGTWTLQATFSGTSSFPGMPDPGFQGQWGITLSC